MPATVLERQVPDTGKSTGIARRRWLVAAAIIVAIWVGYAVFIGLNWPFRRQALIDVLQEASLRTVTIGRFHKTFFPPGCVAENVQFEHRVHKNNPPIIDIHTLTVQGSYWALLTLQYRLSLVRVVRMHVTVPPAKVHGKPDPLMPLNRTPNSVKTLRIDKIIADGAVLDFMHEDGSPPFRLTIDKLAVHGLSNNSAIRYKTILTNTRPPGKIRSEGVFGPWNLSAPPKTPVEGTYEYRDGNLGAFQEFSGIFQAHGSFKGTLGEIRTNGTADVSGFRVAGTGHSRDLKTVFQAHVDGTNGNTTLDKVRAQFDHSTLSVKGTIAGQKGVKGKAMSLDLFCTNARIEDVLDLFIEARRPPMVGDLQMSAHVDVPPPGETSFLERLRMSGDFGVDKSQFTDKGTQADLNRLSASGKSNKNDVPADVVALSDLKGHGDIENGTATLTNLSFRVPEATAKMWGTYSIINYDVNLHGTLFTVGKPWAATTGFKSWMLRIITPFLKKKNDVRMVPFKITGNYSNTNIGLDLGRKNQHTNQ